MNATTKPVRVTATRAANGWTKDHIQHLLATNDRAVERALVQIYHRQTEHEQRTKATEENNGVGFSGIDGEFLTDVAQKCIQFNGLTPRQMARVRPKMMKYWKQLLEIAATYPEGPKFEAPAQPKKERNAKKPNQTQMFN